MPRVVLRRVLPEGAVLAALAKFPSASDIFLGGDTAQVTAQVRPSSGLAVFLRHAAFHTTIHGFHILRYAFLIYKYAVLILLSLIHI